MKEYLVNRAYSLNRQIKCNSQQCELKTLKWLIEDSVAELINASCDQRIEQEYVQLESIELNTNDYVVSTHGKTQVHVICTPANATDRKFHYISSNPEIFTVTTQGVIIGNQPGQASLTVKSATNEQITATANVTVTEEIEKIPVSLGALTNVDFGVDDAENGTILVKKNGKYVADSYTDVVVLDTSKTAMELWSTVVNSYPSSYLVVSPELTNTYPAEVIRVGNHIQIIFTIDTY